MWMDGHHCKVDRAVLGAMAFRFERSESDFPGAAGRLQNRRMIEPRRGIWKKCALRAMNNVSPRDEPIHLAA